MIFIDANYLVSLYIKSEYHYNRALEIYHEIEGKKQIISKSIIAETINILHTKIKAYPEDIERIYNELINKYQVSFYKYYFNNIFIFPLI